ncbi:MAG: DUF1344 domain-containing protein [Chloroflexi bacterium]|nr:DUF1344 domain-containing protein [Chloroflexota bacterium]
MKKLHLAMPLFISAAIVVAAAGYSVAHAHSGDAQGTVESISADGSTIVVDGKTVTISPDTKIKGDLTTGAEVKVKYKSHNQQSPVAAQIKVKHGKSEEEHGKANEEHGQKGRVPPAWGKKMQAEGRHGEANEVEGTIESIAADGSSIVVNGQKIAITSETRVEGKFKQGEQVEVKCRMAADGSLIAVKVEVEDEDDDVHTVMPTPTPTVIPTPTPTPSTASIRTLRGVYY